MAGVTNRGKILIFITALLFSGISSAGLSKCAQFVIGMQSSNVSSLRSVYKLGEKVGLNFEEFLVCKRAIMSHDENLIQAVFDAGTIIKKN